MNKSESKYFNTAAKMDLALIALLKEKPFEYITVSEICKKAEVNRSTFYLHYETIGDLLDESTRYLLDDFLSYFTPDIKSVSLNLKKCRLDELVFIRDEYLIPYLKYVKDNKEIFTTIVNHNKTFKFDAVHRRMFENIYNPILDRFGYPEKNRNYVMMYYLNGIIAVFLEWLKSDCDKSADEVAEIISICIFGLNKDLAADFNIFNK